MNESTDANEPRAMAPNVAREQAPPGTHLQSGHAVMRATIQITRKATGKVEEHELVFTPLPEEPQADQAQPQPQPKEAQ